jgi:GNAT superfamily N-acetyltransferase
MRVWTMSKLPPSLTIGPMRRDEIGILAGWAADEGWNPGLADIEIAWKTDPEAFIALRKGDELVGGGTIMSYGGRFGFMGLFIVRPEFRGGGLGGELWRQRLKLLQARLAPGAAIGMDGVFHMAPFYQRGGFVLAYNDVRFAGTANGTPDPEVRRLDETMFPAIDRYDRAHFPAPRTGFIRRWIFQPGAHALGLFTGDRVIGYAVARPARSGFKIGPVFADRAEIAERLIGSLMALIAGQPVQLDVPEPNIAGTGLARQFGLEEVFGCARMYHGTPPDLPVDRIFGLTSFEFG